MWNVFGEGEAEEETLPKSSFVPFSYSQILHATEPSKDKSAYWKKEKGTEYILMNTEYLNRDIIINKGDGVSKK